MLITYKEGGKTVFPRYQGPMQRPMHPPMQSRMTPRPFNPYNNRMAPYEPDDDEGSIDHLQVEVADYYLDY